ncbi:MAG: Ig-like domain-containing protein, partial [Chloroflexi bacterium]|nr:Ig-like domain-containing protein [Chloroflexota bacterium]
APLSLTFDRLMDTELTAAAIRTEPPAALAPSWRGATLILTPLQPLASGTNYQLTIGREAADVDGNGLARPFSLRFSTVSTGLRVETLVPADGSAGAAPLSPIAIIFDRPIDPGSVAGALTITPPVDGRLEVVGLPRDAPPTSLPEPGPTASLPTTVPVKAPPIGPLRVLQFTPGAPLAGHTTFTVQLRPGAVRALDASQVAAGQSWTFTTGSAPDRLQNQIVFRSARTGITNIWAMNPDGTNARQVTAELTPVTSYDVSSDGSTLVFATAGVVKRMALPGAATTVVTRSEAAEYAPRLHPAGGSVLVARRDRGTGRDAGLWLLPLGDSSPAEQRLLQPGCDRLGSVAPPFGSADAPAAAYDPDGRAGAWATATAFSPDGAVLLVTCGSGDVIRVDTSSGAATFLSLREPIGPPVWAPAHDAFAVAAIGPGSRSGTWFVGRAGLPAAGPDLAAWPSATATGALVGISATRPGRVAYQPPLGPMTLLTLTPELLDRQPVFSPAGDAILFVRVAEDEPTRSEGIWLMAPDGRELRQLSPGGSDPRWLP